MRGNMIEQRAAGLDIGNDRRPLAAREKVFRIDHQQLVAPDHAAFPVDRADPVAIAIESHAEVERLPGDKFAQVGKILFDRGIRVMIGKFAVDLRKEKVVFARQARSELFERGPGGTIARVPADLEPGQCRSVDPIECCKHAIDIGIEHVAILVRARTVGPFSCRPSPAQFLDIGSEERTPLENHLEAIVIGGIMAAGYLDSAIHICG